MTGGQRVLWPYHLHIHRPRTREKLSAPHSMVNVTDTPDSGASKRSQDRTHKANSVMLSEWTSWGQMVPHHRTTREQPESELLPRTRVASRDYVPACVRDLWQGLHKHNLWTPHNSSPGESPYFTAGSQHGTRQKHRDSAGPEAEWGHVGVSRGNPSRSKHSTPSTWPTSGADPPACSRQ